MPLEWTMRTCVIAVGVGRALGLPNMDLSDAYFATLLRSIGCTAFAHEEAGFFGDDNQYRHTYFQVDFGDADDVESATRNELARHAPPAVRHRAVEAFLSRGPEIAGAMADAACPVAVRLATRLQMSEAVRRALTQLWERWDGRGFPSGIEGPALEPAARLLHLGVTVAVDHDRAGPDVARENVQRRRGAWLDPDVADAFLDHAPELLSQIATGSVWDAVLEAEPYPQAHVPDSRVDAVAAAFGDFADLKSPYTLGHAEGVAALAQSAARELALAEGEVTELRLAGLLHDVGRVSVSSGIWDKAGTLSPAEWERVRLHAYYGERVVAQSSRLARLAPIVGHHHERLDGSGYHRAARAPQLDTKARIIAAADVYQALISERPHRPALPPRLAADELRAEVRSGRLDRDAVDAVLTAAGHRASRARADWPRGLTNREVEVLRLLARGSSRKQIASALVISESTVHTHTLHIYEKTGLTNRASVALFAIENDLVHA